MISGHGFMQLLMVYTITNRKCRVLGFSEAFQRPTHRPSSCP